MKIRQILTHREEDDSTIHFSFVKDEGSTHTRYVRRGATGTYIRQGVGTLANMLWNNSYKVINFTLEVSNDNDQREWQIPF